MEYIGIVLSEDSDSLPQAEGSEGMRETADVKKAASALGIPWKTAERYLGNFISRYRVAHRIKNGQYQK